MSFAAGIGAGIAIGIGSGMAIGHKKAAEDLRQYTEAHNITIQDETGQPIPLDDFLDAALKSKAKKNQKLILILSLVLGVMMLLGIVAYLYVV